MSPHNRAIKTTRRAGGSASRIDPGARLRNGEEMTHNRKRIAAAVIAIASLVATVLIAVPALATAPRGVTTTTFGVGRFDAINATTKTDVDPRTATDFWKARIKTKGASDLYVLQNTISPGGTFGWHGHPGPSLVIVKSGTATFYLADDRTCSPQRVDAGQGFVDQGGDVHVVRNEGSVDLVTVVVSLVPAGSQRRIDEPAPANCPTLQNG